MIKPFKLSAIVPSTNISETKRFLIEQLAFEDCPMNGENSHYTIAKTVDTELHIQHVDGPPNEMNMYFLVESVDDVWEDLKDIEGLKKKAPFVRDYGMKEVHVILPHTNTLLFIGEDLG